jgi:hypothetical protein
LKLNYDEPLSSFAYNFNWRHYAAELYRVILVTVFFAQISAVSIVIPPSRGGRFVQRVLETWLWQGGQ